LKSAGIETAAMFSQAPVSSPTGFVDAKK
jgi:hypothetical protein